MSDAAPQNHVARRLVLHVGCGARNPHKLHKLFRGAEWGEVRVDVDPLVAPDIVASITDLSSIDRGSYDAVWASHVLEHLNAHEVSMALREFYRVLKRDGLLLITLPDLKAIAELVVAGKIAKPVYLSKSGPICPIDMLFGCRRAIARGRVFMAHRTGFTDSTLAGALRSAGFARVRVRRKGYDLWARATKCAPRLSCRRRVLVNFAGSSEPIFAAEWVHAQARVTASATGAEIHRAISWTWARLQETQFYRENIGTLDRPRGCGYWLWKPYIIHEALRRAGPDDVIVYWDVGRGKPNVFTRPITPLVDWCLEHNGILPGVLIVVIKGHVPF